MLKKPTSRAVIPPSSQGLTDSRGIDGAVGLNGLKSSREPRTKLMAPATLSAKPATLMSRMKKRKATTIRDRVFDSKEISAEEIKEMAYRANLSVNFINNPSILKKDYDNAERIFLNFIKSFDFHIFAHDCLRRIYKEKNDIQKEREVVMKMKELLSSNEKAKSFEKYFDLLDDNGRFLETEAVV